MDKPVWMWVGFIAIVLVLLIIDLGVFHRKDHVVGIKESLAMTAFYIVIALLFAVWIWFKMGAESTAEYLTGYLVEKTLSMDNIFVISLIFSRLSIPKKYQHRVLFWGILGVIVLRGIMIYLGAQLISQFSWIIYLFSLFLIVTGIKMLFLKETGVDIKKNPVLNWVKNHLPLTKRFHGHDFMVSRTLKNGKIKWYVTPLFIALIFIELVDVMFAVDSVPAIFTITQDPYLVYTSNIFAILGLRSLYFALAAIIGRFYYLKHALALVLVFIGAKVFIADALRLEKFPASLSLSITFGLLLGGLFYSLYKGKPGSQSKKA